MYFVCFFRTRTLAREEPGGFRPREVSLYMLPGPGLTVIHRFYSGQFMQTPVRMNWDRKMTPESRARAARGRVRAR